jgi:hypothetical protein
MAHLGAGGLRAIVGGLRFAIVVIGAFVRARRD